MQPLNEFVSKAELTSRHVSLKVNHLKGRTAAYSLTSDLSQFSCCSHYSDVTRMFYHLCSGSCKKFTAWKKDFKDFWVVYEKLFDPYEQSF